MIKKSTGEWIRPKFKAKLIDYIGLFVLACVSVVWFWLVLVATSLIYVPALT